MPSVFISYRQENEAHSRRVRELAERLETSRIVVVFDQFAQEREFRGGGPDEGWIRWSKRQAASEDHKILIIASAGWFRSYEGTERAGEGLGSAAEAMIISVRLYQQAFLNPYFRLVTFRGGPEFQIPLDLVGFHRFDPDRDFEAIVSWLCAPMPPIGKAPRPPGEGAQGFVAPALQRLVLEADYPVKGAFNGYPAELEQLRAAVFGREGTEYRRRTVVLDGPSGGGKTWLARALQCDHPERVQWASAVQMNPPAPPPGVALIIDFLDDLPSHASMPAWVIDYDGLVIALTSKPLIGNQLLSRRECANDPIITLSGWSIAQAKCFLEARVRLDPSRPDRLTDVLATIARNDRLGETARFLPSDLSLLAEVLTCTDGTNIKSLDDVHKHWVTDCLATDLNGYRAAFVLGRVSLLGVTPAVLTELLALDAHSLAEALRPLSRPGLVRYAHRYKSALVVHTSVRAALAHVHPGRDEIELWDRFSRRALGNPPPDVHDDAAGEACMTAVDAHMAGVRLAFVEPSGTSVRLLGRVEGLKGFIAGLDEQRQQYVREILTSRCFASSASCDDVIAAAYCLLDMPPRPDLGDLAETGWDHPDGFARAAAIAAAVHHWATEGSVHFPNLKVFANSRTQLLECGDRSELPLAHELAAVLAGMVRLHRTDEALGWLSRIRRTLADNFVVHAALFLTEAQHDIEVYEALCRFAKEARNRADDPSWSLLAVFRYIMGHEDGLGTWPNTLDINAASHRVLAKVAGSIGYALVTECAIAQGYQASAHPAMYRCPSPTAPTRGISGIWTLHYREGKQWRSATCRIAFLGRGLVGRGTNPDGVLWLTGAVDGDSDRVTIDLVLAGRPRIACAGNLRDGKHIAGYKSGGQMEWSFRLVLQTPVAAER